MTTITLDLNSTDDYQRFLRVKRLPTYKITGRQCWFPDEYATSVIGTDAPSRERAPHSAPSWMFDYQRDLTELAIKKRKFAFFWDCGLGKTAGILEFARAARDDLAHRRKGVLIVSPLMVVPQTVDECRLFFGDSIDIERVDSADVDGWLQNCGGKIGIANYEAFSKRVRRGQLGALILDESSMLKSHYGKWATQLIDLGKGLDWKLCATGTPAPNDRIEYANHAVFLDFVPTVNAFLATYFVNRGQTGNRWELKPHALEPFYRALSHWCVFLTNPATYGWRDNCESIPPIHTHIERVEMTVEQRAAASHLTGGLFATDSGGIGQRSKLGQIGKGSYQGESIPTRKFDHIRDQIDSWKDSESTIVWCLYNDEQDRAASTLCDAGSIDGSTKHAERLRIVDAFKAGEIRTLISKPKILGFGLNLQIATRQVFSGLQDSYESYYQAVKRSNRYGSTRPLNVHIPVVDVEEPMVQNVLRKAADVERDTREQERLFRENGYQRHAT